MKTAGHSGAAPAATAGKKRKKLRKEEIVAEAAKLFAERGYEGASMGDLADRVGLRKASLFHHFPSKDVLYATVLEELVNGLRASVEAATVAEGSFEERVTRLSDALVTQLGARPNAARLLVREAMDNGPVMRAGLAAGVDGMLKAGCEFFKAGQREGAFDPDLTASHVCITMMGVFIVPFALNDVVERFAGKSPFDLAYVEERKVAIRAQLFSMIFAKKKA